MSRRRPAKWYSPSGGARGYGRGYHGTAPVGGTIFTIALFPCLRRANHADAQGGHLLGVHFGPALEEVKRGLDVFHLHVPVLPPPRLACNDTGEGRRPASLAPELTNTNTTRSRADDSPSSTFRIQVLSPSAQLLDRLGFPKASARPVADAGKSPWGGKPPKASSFHNGPPL